MNKKDIEKLEKAGKIAVEVVAYAKTISKKGVGLLELANKIEDKIYELGGRPAFPVNLSINEIAAHATPSYDETGIAHGLLKVDIGVHIDGFVADTAFSVDLDESEVNKKLIACAQKALASGLEEFEKGKKLRNVGKVIDGEIKKAGFSCVRNLSGHSIEQGDVHAGVTVPNYDNGDDSEIVDGTYAIEPFSTNGSGSVRDGKMSGIYHLARPGNVRDAFAREVLAFIMNEFDSLPFCSRWIHKEFAGRGLIALKFLEQAGVLYQYPQLVESGNGIVAQAEHTVIISGKDKIVTTG